MSALPPEVEAALAGLVEGLVDNPRQADILDLARTAARIGRASLHPTLHPDYVDRRTHTQSDAEAGAAMWRAVAEISKVLDQRCDLYDPGKRICESAWELRDVVEGFSSRWGPAR